VFVRRSHEVWFRQYKASDGLQLGKMMDEMEAKKVYKKNLFYTKLPFVTFHMTQILLEKLTTAQLIKNSQPFMETKFIIVFTKAQPMEHIWSQIQTSPLLRLYFLESIFSFHPSAARSPKLSVLTTEVINNAHTKPSTLHGLPKYTPTDQETSIY
jgi:hypothetical protein